MPLSARFIVRKNVLIVRLTGELDHHEAEGLRETWKRQLFENDVKHVLLNLEGVSFMDSSGLGVILGRYKEILQIGGSFVVCSIGQSVQRLFEMSGLFKIVTHAENEPIALASLGVIAS